MSLYDEYLKQKNSSQDEFSEIKVETKENITAEQEKENEKREKEKQEILEALREPKKEIKEEEPKKEVETPIKDLPRKPSPLKKFLIRFLFFLLLIIFLLTFAFFMYWFFILEDKQAPISEILLNIFR